MVRSSVLFRKRMPLIVASTPWFANQRVGFGPNVFDWMTMFRMTEPLETGSMSTADRWPCPK
jgi:hypothetical protein